MGEINRTHFHRVLRQAMRQVKQGVGLAAGANVGDLGPVAVPKFQCLLGFKNMSGNDARKVPHFFCARCRLVVNRWHVAEEPRGQDRNALIESAADRFGDIADIAFKFFARLHLLVFIAAVRRTVPFVEVCAACH